MRKTMRAWALVLPLLAIGQPAWTWGAEAEGPAPEERIATLEEENTTLRKKVQWLEVIVDVATRRPTPADGRYRDVIDIPIGPNGFGELPVPQHLRDLSLPESPTKAQARDYVATILGFAQGKSHFASIDPEVAPSVSG